MITQQLTPDDYNYTDTLRAMHRPPNPLYYKGEIHNMLARPRVAIVGSRRMTAYGKAITERLARELAGQGVVIVSGLAFGVDAQAHTAALDVGGLTMAVLPSPVEAVAPTAHTWLAEQIVANGGALVSSYAAGTPNHKGNFVARNEIVAALSDAVVITEAAHKSGSIHTASFAQNLGIPVFAVPGSLDMPASVGANNLIKMQGAQLLTGSRDIVATLGIHQSQQQLIVGDSPEQQRLLDLLYSGIQEGSQLLQQSKLPIQVYNHALTMLEVSGKIRPLGGNRWSLY